MSITREVLSRVLPVGWHNQEDRVRWVRAALTRVPPRSRILDAGSGEQQYRQFCSHLEYVGQDFAQYDGAGDKIGLQTGTWNEAKQDIVSDIVAIPEPDSSFDAILCTEVLEHVPDPIAALQEFSRLLKPGGLLILSAPFCSLSHFTPYHFGTGFSRYWYNLHLARLGFIDVEVSENGNFFEFVAQEIWRIPKVMGYAGVGFMTRMFCMVGYAISAPPLLGTLALLSSRGQKSSELLCFGHHVTARRS